jgi:enamine deaminase RidA (YjgF/YER057c/UK114 family)
MSVEDKIKELGINIPSSPKPVASYLPCVIVDNFVYVSGQLPMENGNLKYIGKTNNDNIDTAYNAAKLCVLNALGVVKDNIGSLDKVERVIRVGGFVNSEDGFIMQPKVINGASDLLVEIFGENGKHARAAVGVNELPLNAMVEVELLVKIKN